MRELLHALLWTRRHLAGMLPASELQPLLRLLADDDVFLDVGGHAGSWSVPASRVLTRGRVYAFEALPYYSRVLSKTLAIMGRRNVTVVPAAVSDAEGRLEILWKDDSGRRLTGMTRIRREEQGGETVSVRAITIDGFRRQHPEGRVRLIKCDVEGAELLVLRGAAQTIDTARPLIFCELYEDYCARFGYSARDVFSFFQPRSYTTLQFVSGAFRPIAPAAYRGAGDVLFVPSEMKAQNLCG
jgi:FkbM family methyltransferase